MKQRTLNKWCQWKTNLMYDAKCGVNVKQYINLDLISCHIKMLQGKDARQRSELSKMVMVWGRSGVYLQRNKRVKI